MVTRIPPSSVSLGSDGPHAHIDREGHVSDWDAAFDTLWGRSSAHALGRKLGELLVALEPAELPRFSDVQSAGSWTGIVALVPTNGNTPRTSGIRLTLEDGLDSLRLQLAPLSVMASEGETADAPLDATRDLQRFAALLEVVPGYCYTVDRDLVFTSSAGKGLEMLNLRPGQVIGMKLRSLWGAHEDTYEPLVCHLKALAGIPCTYKDVCLGRSIEYLIRPLRGADGDVVGAIGVAVDVTEGELARAEQAKLSAQLLQAQKVEALGRLAGGVAHDFNNFLTCIMGNLSLLERLVEGSAEAQAFLAQANAAVDSAASLTRQLLAFSRKQVISPRPIQLGALVARLDAIFARLVGHRIQLRSACSPDLWSVKADPGQIEQVLVNLVMNARDAISDQGQITIEARNLELTTAGAELPEGLRPGEYVALSVSDTGRGLSDVVRARLFEPFFTTKEIGVGTGLGLATVQAAVQQSGGAITVDSELGRGSTFRILLPRVERPAQPDAHPHADSMGTSVRELLAVAGGTETILLVEDEPLVLELAQRTLQQLGYNVLPCSGPDEALRTFGEYQSRIELLVTDLVMPRMNGKELAARIRALSPGIAVLLSSGDGESTVAKRDVLEHGVPFIGKPYRPNELALMVRSLLDRRGRQRAAHS
jgi:signal transduction histidine kinase/ActR/RegA family two-component response regulator